MPKIKSLHVNKLPNGKYQYVVETPRVNGKRTRRYGTFNTKQEAVNEGRRVFDYYYFQGTGLNGDISYEDFAEIWLEKEVSKKVAGSTVESYRKRLKNLINPYIGDKLVRNILPLHIYELIDILFNKGVSKNTLVSVKAILTSSFRFGVINRYIVSNPATDVSLPTENKDPNVPTRKSPHHFLTDRVMWKVFEELKDNETYTLIVKVGYLCGLRHAEIFGLFWDDIDFIGKKLTVNRQLQYKKDLNRSKQDILDNNGTSSKGNGYWYYKQPKYNSRRTIIMPDELVDLFLKYKEKCYSNYINPDIKSVDNYIEHSLTENYKEFKLLDESKTGYKIDPVFVHQNNRFMNSNICQHICSRIHKNVTPDFDMHSLRKTHSTVLQNQGLDIRYIANRLGHIDLNTTKEVYYQLSQGKILEEDSKLNNFFEEIKEKGLLEGEEFLTMKDVMPEDEKPDDWIDKASDTKW